MEWNSRKSLALSKVFTILFIIAVAGVMAAAPWLTRWLIRYSLTANKSSYQLFLATLYSGGALGILMLCNLYKMLDNFTKGQVFTHKKHTAAPQDILVLFVWMRSCFIVFPILSSLVDCLYCGWFYGVDCADC